MGKRREVVATSKQGIDMDYDDSSSDEENTSLGKKALLSMAKINSGEEEMEVDEVETKTVEKKDNEQPKEFKNRQRVMLLCSRGITARHRHLMSDLQALLPHAKKDSKLDSKSKLYILNELADINNCNNCIYFEGRKHTDLYMWISKTPNGPSIKFHVTNIHTMSELHLTGNCLKGSRPIVSFDKTFDSTPHYKLIKEVLLHNFSTPTTSRRIKPFVDHVITFSIVDGRIWFRNYQIVEKNDGTKKEKEMSLVEIGPRFVLQVMRIFDGSFCGSTLYKNGEFVSPNMIRRFQKQEMSMKYNARVNKNLDHAKRLEAANNLPSDPLDEVFK